jgi:acyl-homoserine lactone acylase PvdQ
MVRILCCLLLALPAGAEKISVYRDRFGTPHIYAETLEGMAFASGYAQAEDRLEELLRNYRKAEGTMAEAFGEQFFLHDYRQRLWRHREISREKFATAVSPPMRKMCEAFIAGVKKYMQEHPEQVPAWAPQLDPAQVIALGRYIIWGWPEGEAGGDLRRAKIALDQPEVYRGSNQWLVAPQRSALKAPIALIDPHLSWYGEFRFYEIRLYARQPEFAYSGASILGLPFPALGHSRYASVAMTTGGPDTSDIFEEELNPANRRQYKYDGQWREMTVRREKIGVKKGDIVEVREVEIAATHHGPVVAHKDGKAYAVAIPYALEVGLMDQTYRMATARNLAEMKQALGMLQLMAQNIMVGTVDGDIYYVRNGRVPVRAPGTDPSLPIPGSASRNEWRGLHAFADLVQIANPPQGYMQNNNISPFGMMKDSPLTPEKYAHAPYLYNDTRRPNHQRAQMTLEELAADDSVTLDDAFAYAFSTSVYKADVWQERIKKAAGELTGDARQLEDLILAWNRRSDPESTGAMAFRAFKLALGGDAARAMEPPAALSDAQVREALAKAAAELRKEFGSLQVRYGDFFRVGREGGQNTWPVGGGSVAEAGMATPRAIGFTRRGSLMVGRSGQTSTQVVVLSKPPKSWSVIPLGESDRPGSPHWDDQARQLFSAGKMKPTYFLDRKELRKNLASEKTLEW